MTGIRFSALIRNSQGLKSLVERFAPDASVSWRFYVSDQAISGTRRFTFRTPLVRIALYASAVLVLFVFAFSITDYLHGQSDALSVGVMLLVFYCAALGWLHLANVTTDETGITKAGLGGRRFIRWSDISEYYRDTRRSGTLVIRSTSKNLTISPLLDCVDDLMSEVEQRSVNATTKRWDMR